MDRDGAPVTMARWLVGGVSGAIALYVASLIWSELPDPDEVEECWWEDRTYVCR